jgi:hypothetical protein
MGGKNMTSFLRRVVTTTAVVALCVPQLVYVSPAYAWSSTPCVPKREVWYSGYQWDGWTGNVASINAVEANILAYKPHAATAGFTTAWIMLPGSGNWQILQVGPYRSEGTGGTGFVDFIQWRDGPGDVTHQHESAGQTVGTTHKYDIFFDRTYKQFTIKVDDKTLWPSWPINTWLPVGAQFFGEIADNHNQMPGDTGSHEKFTGNKVRVGTTWKSFSTASTNEFPIVTVPASHGQSGTANNFDIWDGCR